MHRPAPGVRGLTLTLTLIQTRIQFPKSTLTLRLALTLP